MMRLLTYAAAEMSQHASSQHIAGSKVCSSSAAKMTYHVWRCMQSCGSSGFGSYLTQGLLLLLLLLCCCWDMGYSGCSRQSYKLPSPMWDRQSPPRAHTRIRLSHRLPCDHSSLHLYHLPRFARFPAV